MPRIDRQHIWPISSLTLAAILAAYTFAKLDFIPWPQPPPAPLATGLPPMPATAPKMAGKWCVAGKKAEILNATDSSLIIKNESGMATAGYMKDSQTVVAVSWGNLEGKVSDGGRKLRWGDGTLWSRC